jgi:hypothetical protein
MDNAAEAIVTELERRIGSEIDIVFRYGSTLTDRSHRWSDVDMSYVPREPSPDDPSFSPSWQSITVLVDDILFDLYPIGWPALQGMAEWNDWRSTILRNPRVVYARTDSARSRFVSLQERHRELALPESRTHMVRKAWEVFRGTGYHFQEVNRLCTAGEINAARFRANQLVQIVLHTLVVLNQASIDTRRIDEVLSLPLLPDGIEQAMDAICTVSDTALLEAAIGDLVLSTRRVLLTVQRSELTSSATHAEMLSAAYPELRSDLQRAIVAAERGDRFAAQTKAMSFVHELSFHAAFGELGFAVNELNSLDEYRVGFPGMPDLIEVSASGTLEELAAACETADAVLKSWLGEQGVGLNSYEDLPELLEGFARGEV